MSEVERFLSASEEQEIIQAIREAEQDTSGEIRVHIENGTGTDPMERAKVLFHELKMDNTRNLNGVLLYIAVHDHQFAICGDRGICAVVPENFWDSTRDQIQLHFKKGAFKEGIIAGILNAGKELHAHFPWNPEDTNELTNEISKG
ncbi:TPM domain-containing protein [Robiginitalea aurantiaca]|uniref:TPM domain-containing protein n=1 Tax=Robiginitalea aurantiaca TaxID=3056915 RepID=A0ABT7WF84_9FLAO|nr:TPM domain-containing protein [Robiginitalea aurantiaca]MDM9631574.1 TPM domain-containing protein [Robiginitalea aurantiaca]